MERLLGGGQTLTVAEVDGESLKVYVPSPQGAEFMSGVWHGDDGTVGGAGNLPLVNQQIGSTDVDYLPIVREHSLAHAITTAFAEDNSVYQLESDYHSVTSGHIST